MGGVRRVAVVASVLALAATGCASDGSPDDPTTARGQVQQLTAALVDVDADALVALVGDDSSVVSTALLVDDVLEQGALARTDVRIEAKGGDLAYATWTLDTDPPADRGGPWLRVSGRRSGDLVGSVLPVVTVAGEGVTALRVGDVEVPVDPLPPEGQRFLVPPGELSIAGVGPEGLVTHEPATTVDTRDVERDRVRVGGELTAAGRAQVQQAADAFVRRCTRPLQGKRPAVCPLRKAFLGGLASSAWTLDGPVRVTTNPDGSGWAITTPRPPVARMRGEVLDRETGALVPVTDRVRFRVEGRVTAVGDRLVVDVPGY